MKVLLHLLRCELRDRRFFFLVALLASFVPWAVTALASPAEDRDALRRQLAQGLLILALPGLPLATGARWLVAGLGPGGRRQFELERPATPFQLFASKGVSILVVISGGLLLAAMPSILTDRERVEAGIRSFLEVLFQEDAPRHFSRVYTLPSHWLAENKFLLLLGTLPLAMLLLVVLAQGVSVAFAGRGRGSLALLGSCAVFGIAVAWSLRQLIAMDALGIGLDYLPKLVLAVAGIGFWSAFRSLAAGVLPERAHRAFLQSMSLGLVLLGAWLAARIAAETRPSFAKLRSYAVLAANAEGTRWLVGGIQDRRGFTPTFLVDPEKRQATYVAPLMKLAPPFQIEENHAFLGLRGYSGSHYTDDLLYLAGEDAPIELPAKILAAKGPDWANISDTTQLAMDAAGSRLVVQNETSLVVFRLPEGEELGRVGIPSSSDPDGFVRLVHRKGSEFDLLLSREDDENGLLTIDRLRFDAAALSLAPAGSWRVPLGDRWLETDYWWVGVLPLLDAGAPLAALTAFDRPLPSSEAGSFLALDRPYFSRLLSDRWIFVNRQGNCTGFLDLEDPAQFAGEIEPGVVAVSLPGQRGDLLELFEERGPDAFADWTLLLIEVKTGRILRRLPGLAPGLDFAGRRTFFTGPYGEPFDLKSAAAQPRRILPWRPQAAAEEAQR